MLQGLFATPISKKSRLDKACCLS